MAPRNARQAHQIDRALATVDPVRGHDFATESLETALDGLGAAIMTEPRGASPARRKRWLTGRRRVLLVAAALLTIAGGAAAATKLLTAHTGIYPTKR